MFFEIFVVSVFVSQNAAFLLDSRNTSSAGTNTQSSQYLTVSEYYEDKTKIRHQFTDLQSEQEKTINLLAQQLQQRLAEMEKKLPDTTSQNKTRDELDKRFLDMEKRYSELQQKYNSLQKKYDQQQTELVVARNISSELQNRIGNVEQLGNINQIKVLHSVQQQVHDMSSDVNRLMVKEQARGQDFLALYNISSQSTKSIEKLQNQTKTQQYQIDRTTSQFTQDLHNLHNITENQIIAIQQKAQKHETQAVKDRMFINGTLSTLKRDLDSLGKTVLDHPKYAFFASITQARSNLPAGSILKFDRVHLNIGNAYNATRGKFTCHADGVYMFSWTALSFDNKDFTSELVINGRYIAQNTVDNDATGDALSGSNTVLAQMKNGESAWIEVQLGSYVSEKWSGNAPNTVFFWI